jgi:trehalose 6-phosphate synthase
MPSLDEPKNEARLLLVSNRLPITIKRSEDGKYDFSMSSGGLVSGLSGLSKSTTFQWYGWPGLEVPEPEIPVVKQRLKEEYGAVPVFIDDDLADRHYNGFSSVYPVPFHPNPLQRPPALRKGGSSPRFILTTPLYRLYPLAAVSLSPG